MRVFILRARKGATAPEFIKKSIGYPDHFEVIAHSVVSALMISKYTRDDVILHVVMEGNPNSPVTVTFDTSELGSLGGFDEHNIAAVFERVLKPASSLAKGSSKEIEPGLSIRKISFEPLVKELVEEFPIYLLDKKGEDLREADFPGTCGFIFTDHIPMQKKTLNLLARLGVRGLSLGPKMLFAAHCITLVHNELDRRGL